MLGDHDADGDVDLADFARFPECATGPDAGPPSDFQPVVNRGKGNLPGAKYYHDDHSHMLVPLFAKGVGSEKLLERVRGIDPVYGRYVDNTDVFDVIKAVLELQIVPSR